MDNEIRNVELVDYILKAKEKEPLDFKYKGMDEINENTIVSQHYYRGMSFTAKVAWAGDIGNYVAGYIARKHGQSFGVSRIAFDAIQIKQKYQTWNVFKRRTRKVQAQSTQRAERADHNVAFPIYKQQLEKELQKVTNPWPIGPKH
ncbi:hypothetical protein ACYSNM_08565 [Myroides sp. LJL116]